MRVQRALPAMAAKATEAAIAKMVAALAVDSLPSFPTPSPDAGTAPSQEGQSSRSAADAAPSPSQEGMGGPSDDPGLSQERRDVRTIKISVARASLIALYDFFEPAIAAQGMVIPEDGLGLALGAALLAYGVAATSSWLRDAATGIISTSGATLSARSAPGVAVSYTHLRAPETALDLVCRLLLEKKTKSCSSHINTTPPITPLHSSPLTTASTPPPTLYSTTTIQLCRPLIHYTHLSL